MRALVPRSPCRRLLLVATVALALLGVIVGTLTLLAFQRRPADPVPTRFGQPGFAAGSKPSSPAGSPPSSYPSGTRSSVSARSGLPPLRRTANPATYAREVATALFDVDTARVSRAAFLAFWRGELPTAVYSDGAVKGLTLAAQNADAIDNLTHGWIPPQSAWNGEAADDTVSRLRITSVSVPAYWVNAVAAGEFTDPGLHMERVMGVLTQTYGRDRKTRVTAKRAVVIDLGLLCGPTQPGGCRLLAPQAPVGQDDGS